MSIENVACTRCGALMEIEPSVHLVTCRACGTTLAIHRNDSSAWTEPTATDEVAARLDAVEAAADQLAVRSELDALDRQWERDRQQHMILLHSGVRKVPDKTTSILIGVAIGVFGVAWMAITAGLSWIPLLGLLFIAFGVGVAIWAYRKAVMYQQGQERYQARRAELEKKLVH
jgi:hypothetical protein